jgi:hypothetical protein
MNHLKLFHCTQRELYAICAHAWETCSQNLERFGRFKTKYNQAFIDRNKAEIARVEALNDQYQRSGKQENVRLELKEQVELCLLAWRKLKTYIIETWPEEEKQKICFKIAGQAYYREAYNLKWESCQSMMSNGEAFIRENAQQLSEHAVIDERFVAEFGERNTAFLMAYKAYLDGIRDSQLSTAEKAKANNRLYKDMMSMFIDARMIFRKEPELLKHFVFDSVLLLVSGPGTAGIKGSIIGGRLSASDFAGLEVSLLESGETVPVNEDGTYRFSQLAAGVYTLYLSAPGYKEQEISGVQVNVGTYATRDIVLEKDLVG